MTKSVWIQDGCIRLPDDERERAGIAADDELFITSAAGVIILSSHPTAFAQHAAEFERLMDEVGMSEASLVEGIHRARKEIYREQHGGG